MKRCPQCFFIYPDSDSVCDFDQSALVDAAESEIAAITNTPEQPALADLAATHSRKFEERKSRKALPITAAVGLTFGILTVGVYFAVHRQMRATPLPQPTVVGVAPNQIVTPTPSPVPSPTVLASPSPEPTAVPKQSTSTMKTAHSATSNGPVSTKPTVGTKSKSVILLTSGGKVEADEVWRTKDGVWYRRDGVVTLLKKNRVKAIVKS